MSMKQAIAFVLQHYGSTVEAVTGESTRSFRAFLQPVTSKSWQNMEHTFGPLGEIPRGQYLYIGPAAEDILGAEFLRCHGEEYLVRRADALLFGDEALYIWGLCVKKGGDDPWSS